MIVAPSFLTADLHRLEAEIASVRSADWLHFDVMDGKFVPAVTYDHGLVATVRGLQRPLFRLPSDDGRTGSVVFPLRRRRCGLDHLPSRSVRRSLRRDRAAARARPQGRHRAQAGDADRTADAVSFRPRPRPRDVGRAREGRPDRSCRRRSTGSPGSPTFRAERGLDFLIQVDGGINGATAPLVRRAGADVVVAGSFIFNRSDREAAIAELAHGRAD
ncbi:MAG: hypothetical protein MZU97_09675 [Bacillus subtilis]|nr:hypothetical protein [Bacillus subtilis]